MNPKNDPLVKATRKAYRDSAVGQFELSVESETKGNVLERHRVMAAFRHAHLLEQVGGQK